MQVPKTFWKPAIVSLGLIATAQASPARTMDEASASHPMGRMARLINPSLVDVEERIDFLEKRLQTLAAYSPKPSRHAYGWRAGHLAGEETPPNLTLDLGDIYPLSDLWVLPSWPQFGEDRLMFPLRLQVEVANQADFSDATVVYSTSNKIHEDQSGHPLRIPVQNIDARYVRLKVLLGHFRGPQALSTISELMVFSGGEPVSLSASVTASGSIDSEDQWNPAYAIDGRTPLGCWQGGAWTKSRGQLVELRGEESSAQWQLDCGEVTAIDRVLLFPYELPEFGGSCALPGRMEIAITDGPEPADSDFHPYKGGETFCPVIHSPRGTSGRYVTIRGLDPLEVGELRALPLSEIEVWSLGRNLARDGKLSLSVGGKAIDLSPEVHDGYANGLKIIPMDHWLRQIDDRRLIQAELASLHPLRAGMIAESELNATWGASVAIGLTFLIPVAIVERRRLVSRKQIDTLRKRIASDLHDDIGSNLGSISLIARSAKRDLVRLHGPDAVAEDLSEVETIARESSLAMRDIVWLLERRQDSIGDFVQRMRDTAARMLRDIRYDIHCSSNRTAAKMTLDAKRHLFLFYKETLHNIVKHSKADQVAIRIYDHGDSLVMEVEDNGIGLPVDAAGKAAAVRKLNDRAEVLSGRLTVESQPGQGTSLRLEVKRSNLVASKAAA
ncbi:MAG: histidine kinase [Akkermansiaceae bacterium]|jgi:signal transduction histidine kinase|nr:histidine kinase [Akkermansiaceae bacterium]